MMISECPSKKWSCNSLQQAAAQVADQAMATPDLEAEAARVELEAGDLSLADLEKLLHDPWNVFGRKTFLFDMGMIWLGIALFEV